MDFQNKVAVVTGGASGIGLACCREFAQRHADVAVVDLDEKAGRRAAKELRQGSGRVEFFSVDASKGSQVEAGVARIARKLGGIDILINNAGIQRYASATTCTEEEWDLVLGVNLKSAFLMSKYVIPVLIERGGGAIRSRLLYHRCGRRGGRRAHGAGRRHGVPGRGLASGEGMMHYYSRSKASRILIAKRKTPS